MKRLTESRCPLTGTTSGVSWKLLPIAEDTERFGETSTSMNTLRPTRSGRTPRRITRGAAHQAARNQTTRSHVAAIHHHTSTGHTRNQRRTTGLRTTQATRRRPGIKQPCIQVHTDMSTPPDPRVGLDPTVNLTRCEGYLKTHYLTNNKTGTLKTRPGAHQAVARTSQTGTTISPVFMMGSMTLGLMRTRGVFKMPGVKIVGTVERAGVRDL